MVNLFRTISFLMCLIALQYSYAEVIEKPDDLTKLSCKELIFKMLNESSMHDQFVDKRIALECFFERSSNNLIVMVCVRRAGIDKDGIYSNYMLNLKKQTLIISDLEIPLPVKINTKYVPYIAQKCTPEENEPYEVRHLPD